jgi:hypothetical protein
VGVAGVMALAGRRLSGITPDPYDGAPMDSETGGGNGRDEPTGPASLAAVDPGAVAPTLPSTAARVVGFIAILAAGAAGGFIGYAVADLQCTGDCTVTRGLSGLVGAVVAAVGVAVVVQLALRAMHEWRVVEARGGTERRARPSPRTTATRPRPRVR